MRAGKVSVTVIIIVAFIVGLGVMALSTGESPMSVGSRFMLALKEKDVDELAALSYAEDVSEDELRQQWDYTMNVVAPYYQFAWEIKSESKPAEGQATVRMMYVQNAGASGTYDESFELPMVLTDEGWKVDVYALNRDMFPGLPRG